MWGRLKVTLHSPIIQVATDWRGRKLFIKAWILQHLNSSFSSHVCSKKCNFDHITIYVCDRTWHRLIRPFYHVQLLVLGAKLFVFEKKTHDTVTHWVFEIHLFKIFSAQDSAASPSHLVELRNLNLCGTETLQLFGPLLCFFQDLSISFMPLPTHVFLDLFSNTFLFQLLNLISMMLRRGVGGFLLSG